MLTRSHLALGRLIIEQAQTQLGFNLSKLNFLYGCIKPDLIPCHINKPHKKEDSYNEIKWELERLCNFTIDSTKDSRVFSQRLGIVTHYISDYFTLVHNNSAYYSLLPHALYEGKLHKCLKRSIMLSNHKSIEPFLTKDVVNSLGIWLTYQHQQYLGKKNSPVKDIRYIINVSIKLALSIIKSNIEKKNVAKNIA